MELVVVERILDAPSEFAALNCMEARAGWCLEMHRVRPLVSYVASHLMAAVCLYEAPDAEAVRVAQTQAGLPCTHVWTAQRVRFSEADGARPGWSTIVARREIPQPATEELLRESVKVGASCLRLHRISPLVSYLARSGLRSVCVFEAPDAEAVRIGSRQMQMPLSEAWPATFHRAP